MVSFSSRNRQWSRLKGKGLVCLSLRSSTIVFLLAFVVVNLIWLSRVSEYSSTENSMIQSAVKSSSASVEMKTNHPDTSIKPDNNLKWTVDILSIGSKTRPGHQQAQLETFASHPYVRHSMFVNELNDTEADCHTKLTANDVHAIRYRCSRHSTKYKVLQQLFRGLFASPQYLERKGNVVGWLCAQKRPIDGLQLLYQRHYYSSEHTLDPSSLPDYLLLIDDDTYVNVPSVVDWLMEAYGDGGRESSSARIVAGCLTRIRWYNFSFPYGGWGTFLSRETLRRLATPLVCNHTSKVSSDDNTVEGFQEHACRRLKENGVGEQEFWKPNQSLLNVMTQYTFDQPYSAYNTSVWDGKPGFCFHSDTLLAYFGNYYHTSEHVSTSDQGLGHPRYEIALAKRRKHKKQHPETRDSYLDKKYGYSTFHFDEDRLVGYQGSIRFAGNQEKGARKQKRECLHTNDTNCPEDAHLCHYVTPPRMKELWIKQGSG